MVLPFHRLSFGLWLKVVDPTLILNEKTVKKLVWSASKIARFASDRVRLVSFWPGAKSRGAHLMETFDIPISLSRMFSTRSRKNTSSFQLKLS